MINAVNEVMNDKTISQYKIIEDRYELLKKFLRSLINENRLDVKNVKCFLDILDNKTEAKYGTVDKKSR